MFDTLRDFHLGARALAEMEAVQRACASAELPLVLVNMPLSPDFGGYWPGRGWAAYEEYLQTLRALAQRWNRPLLDLHAMGFVRTDFDDSHHLARAGARRASLRLGAFLRERGLTGR